MKHITWQNEIRLLPFAIIIILIIFGPLIAPFDPNSQHMKSTLLTPLAHYANSGKLAILGTDELGRDIFSRILYGGQLSLLISIVAVLVSGTIGLIIGTISGYLQRFTDTFFMSLGDIQLSIPSILLAIVIISVFGSGIVNVIAVLSITGWVSTARVVRSRVIQLKETDFIQSAELMGLGHGIIIWHHVLPNVMNTFITQEILQISRMILFSASLSYLGVGVSLSTITWGGMINEGQNYLQSAWWIATIPGVCIAVVVVTINLFGEWLQNLLVA
ncbi:binding-protein-dependent transport systems inner membrane component [Liquorilactobacillus ghanensis DSM 18630]|uniref:Binding-protein-dependent transport systems inner membrane component n=1 Tax=Liquorilactobacillus ghanensis DSM 18630 TaxID=1423750 RepID=A0A0R1VLK6_9LACO|nr:ABC transporter permease [Liquorilactobacillus ghanensis]KRM06205.1 binding-protein-dependent transport systems inner membrane component [Liquorilactobacillus ghanensis DSM 18630]